MRGEKVTVRVRLVVEPKVASSYVWPSSPIPSSSATTDSTAGLEFLKSVMQSPLGPVIFCVVLPLWMAYWVILTMINGSYVDKNGNATWSVYCPCYRSACNVKLANDNNRNIKFPGHHKNITSFNKEEMKCAEKKLLSE